VQRFSDPFQQDAEVQAFCRLAGIQYQARRHCICAFLLPLPCWKPSACTNCRPCIVALKK
jgi:hypothetical protein